MKFDYYGWPPPRRSRDQDVKTPISIESLPKLSVAEEGERYIPHEGLQAAVNVALLLGKPLLVTGEPGTGKTRLAESIKWQLGLKHLFKFAAKSTSTGRDLLYNYDAIGRFYAAEATRSNGSAAALQTRNPSRAINFITYAALGEAILRAHPQGVVQDFLPPAFKCADQGERSVVLIDEIDKASRDFPNDLLNEIDVLQFRVPEVSEEMTPEITNRSLRPIIVITSNQERNLPEPFLRRCIYFNIPFPPEKGGVNSYSVENIVAQRFLGHSGDFAGSKMAGDAIKFFLYARELQPPLGKRPATAELIDWIEALMVFHADKDQDLKRQPELAQRSIYALFKGEDDLKRGRRALKEWFSRSSS